MTRGLAGLIGLALLMATSLAGGCGDDGGPRDAADLYSDYCTRCHADDGQGDRKKRALNPGLDLTVSTWIADGAREEIRQRIADGHGSMPGFSKKLSAEEIEAVVDYLERFRPPEGGPASEPGS